MKSICAGHCWVHELFEHVQKIRTDLPKLHGWEEHCPNWLSLSLSLLEWPGMTRNYHLNKLELAIHPHSGVDSAVRLGHKETARINYSNLYGIKKNVFSFKESHKYLCYNPIFTHRGLFYVICCCLISERRSHSWQFLVQNGSKCKLIKIIKSISNI